MGDPRPTKLSAASERPEALGQPDRHDLRSIAGELFEIARRLNGAALASDHAPPARDVAENANVASLSAIRNRAEEPGKLQPADRANYAWMAREIYAIRRQRVTIFDDTELFGEPAWDILLDLYVACAEDKKVSVSSACIGSASPPTTGLRWLGVLADKGLIVRERDPADQRRVLVRLSDKGLAAMDAYFACAASRF